MPQPPQNTRDFSGLLAVVKALRGPDGCPWDKEQSHSTLTQYAIEEAHELAEAIDRGEQKELIEELGDLLLQVVLHAEIARQDARFQIEDVIESICQKMIRRHPHVFSDVKVKGSAEVISNWQDIKAKEKPKSSTFDIPKSLPALIRSQKIGVRTKKMAFDWSKSADVIKKIDEEIDELKEAVIDGDTDAIQMEIGDVLFSVAQLSRHLELDAEQTLRLANQRFENRFQKMQELALNDNKNWLQLDSSTKEQYWQRAKAELSHKNTP